MILTDKQRIFIDEYLKCWNGAEAARRAGYPKRSARQIATENLSKPDIRAEIEQRMKDSAMSAAEVLARLSDQARGSLETFTRVSKDGFLYFDFSDKDAKAGLHLLKKVKTKRSRRVQGKGKDAEDWEDEYIEVELHDQQKALDLLAKYHNLYAEKDDDGNPVTDEQRTARLIELLDALRARRDREALAGNSPSIPASSETPGSST